MRNARRPSRALLAPILLAAVATLAPSAGNIGSCGQTAEALDEAKFFAAKRAIDCEQCTSCELVTGPCAVACAGGDPDLEQFPEGCLPLVHDGEVCLDALRASSCDEFAAFVADSGATIPTECNFCPLEDRPGQGGAGGAP